MDCFPTDTVAADMTAISLQAEEQVPAKEESNVITASKQGHAIPAKEQAESQKLTTITIQIQIRIHGEPMRILAMIVKVQAGANTVEAVE